jgi:hypothetical protein
MADNLKIKSCVSSIKGDCDTLQATDLTGTFSVTNPTGYGAPNSLRSDWRMGLLCDSTLSSGERFPMVVTPVGGVETAAEWKINVPQDSVYEIMLLIAKPWDVNLEYVKDNIRYGSYDNQGETISGFFVAQQAVPELTLLSDATFWSRIVKIDDYPLFSTATGAQYSLKSKLISCHSDACIGNKARAYAHSHCAELAKSIEQNLDFFKTVVHYSAAIYSARFGDLAETRAQIELTNKLCNECTCGALKRGSTVHKANCGCK